MFRHYELFDENRQTEICSLQELKAKKWRRENEARLAREEMDQMKKRLEALESQSAQLSENLFQSQPDKAHNSAEISPPKPSGFDSPKLVQPVKEKPAFQIFTGNREDESTLDLGASLPQPATDRFTPLRQPVDQFSSPKPNVSLLTPVRKPEMGGLLAKRNNSHLTPLADRQRSVDPDNSAQKTKPTTTPTAVINEVNDMVKGFFNSTNSEYYSSLIKIYNQQKNSTKILNACLTGQF